MRGPLLVGAICVAAAGCTLLVDTKGLSGGTDSTGQDASSGSSGTSGTSGTSGSSGTSGTSGTSGSHGTSGHGTSGSSGTSGTSGSSGTSGGPNPGTATGPVSTGLSPGARISCAGGMFDCNPPGQACCVIFGNQLDFCIDPARPADCKSNQGFPTAIAACNDEGDCPTGQLCCVGLGDSAHPITPSACATSCPPGQYAMCRGNGGAPCPSGQSCQRITALDANGNYGYRVCK